MTERTGSTRGGDRGSRESSERSGYRYQSRSPDAMKKRGDQGGTDFDTYIKDIVNMFKPNDGDNIIRALPPTWDNPEHYGLDIYVHYGVGPDNQAYLCLEKMLKKPCPVCEEMHRASKTGDEDYAKKLKPNKRVLFYLVDRNNEKDGVQAWASPWTIDRDICKISVDKRSGEVLELDNPEDGYDIEFERKGKGERTEYIGLAIARRSSPLGDDAWLDFAEKNSLPSVLNYYEYDHIAQVFGGASKQEPERDQGQPSRGRGEPAKDAVADATWDRIHAMTYDEMGEFIEREKLGIDPEKSKNDEDLADWICDEMKIEKEVKTRTRTRITEEETDADRLRKMRESRG